MEYSSALNNKIVALIEDDSKTLKSSIISKNVIGFILIKEVNLEAKIVSVLLPTEAPILSTLGVLSDTTFMDDMMNRL